MLIPIAADLLELVDEYDEFVQSEVKPPYGLDQVNVWRTEAQECALTLTYRPYHMVNTHRFTTWCYIPLLDEDAPVQVVRRDHAAMLRLIEPQSGICDTYVNWIVKGSWMRLPSGVYSLNIQRERITRRTINV